MHITVSSETMFAATAAVYHRQSLVLPDHRYQHGNFKNYSSD